jgi:phage shock protein E
MSHNPRYRKLVDEVRQRVAEVSPEAARSLVASQGALLIDVRDGAEWRSGHADGALHLSKGIIELEIEEAVPDTGKPIICYCGGGSRSLLAADNLRKMGYHNVLSMHGGFRAWREAGLPIERGSDE